MNTVAQARTYVTDAVKGGSSPSSSLVLATINRAQLELLANDDLTVTDDANIGGILTVTERITCNGFLFIDSATATISGGEVTVTKSMMLVDTEGAASTDDLLTINGGITKMTVILKTQNDARDVVVKHATGNIRLASGADYTLANVNYGLWLRYDGSVWREISRSA
jgi:hypothetical protein